MTKRKFDFTLPTNSLDELFSSREERDDAKLERVRDIPLNELHPFKDHPFKIQSDEEMKRLIESIQKFGTLTPALARPLPEGGYELISGHRRLAACQVLGIETMAVIIQDEVGCHQASGHRFCASCREVVECGKSSRRCR